MKKRKGIIIILVVLVVDILVLFFCDKMEKKLQSQIKLSNSELEEYTSLAYDLEEIRTGKITKILVQGQKKKISFVFSGDRQVTVNYSGEYKINSKDATIEHIDSSMLVLDKLLNLNINKIYRIEFDTIEKIIAIQGSSTSKGIFVVDLSNDKNITKSFKATQNSIDHIYRWKIVIPMWIISSTIILYLYLLEQYLRRKKHQTKKQ